MFKKVCLQEEQARTGNKVIYDRINSKINAACNTIQTIRLDLERTKTANLDKARVVKQYLSHDYILVHGLVHMCVRWGSFGPHAHRSIRPARERPRAYVRCTRDDCHTAPHSRRPVRIAIHKVCTVTLAVCRRHILRVN
jgi:hypothetical protein